MPGFRVCNYIINGYDMYVSLQNIPICISGKYILCFLVPYTEWQILLAGLGDKFNHPVPAPGCVILNAKKRLDWYFGVVY